MGTAIAQPTIFLHEMKRKTFKRKENNEKRKMKNKGKDVSETKREEKHLGTNTSVTSI